MKDAKVKKKLCSVSNFHTPVVSVTYQLSVLFLRCCVKVDRCFHWSYEYALIHNTNTLRLLLHDVTLTHAGHTFQLMFMFNKNGKARKGMCFYVSVPLESPAVKNIYIINDKWHASDINTLHPFLSPGTR